MKVNITAERTVRLSRIVDMTDADFAEYERLCEELHGRSLDKAIETLASKHGFCGDAGDEYDWDDLEEITFEKCRDQAA